MALAGCAAETAGAGEALLGDGESVCGGATDWQDVESYDGTLGPSTAFVDRHERPVGYVDGRCTGTLIANSLFLTAGHCFGSAADAEGLTVMFNYQDAPNGTPREIDEYEIIDLVEHRDEALHGGDLDYALVRLSGSPGVRWGTSRISAREPFDGLGITIIQHPSGIPKVVEGGTVSDVGTATIGYSNLDTEGGTSGAGVLDGFGNVVAVHERGGCDTPGGDNGATRMDSILDFSSTLGGTDHLWLGRADRTFGTSIDPTDASGTYVPIGGDFDGDGRGDIFWYGPGASADHLWYGTAVTGSFSAAEPPESVDGPGYIPLAGDFDDDGRTDIFWYGPGALSDAVWYGTAGRSFVGVSSTVNGVYRPVVGDFDGDDRSDIFWYGPGTVGDSVWYGAAGRTFTSKGFTVNGEGYIPIAGDFNGNGRDDIFWYGPGSVGDSIWWGIAGRAFDGDASVVVNGHYQPIAGDFDGNGVDDVLWYGPASAFDAVWYGATSGSFTDASATVDGLYTPIVGRFDGNARDDIFWYRPG